MPLKQKWIRDLYLTTVAEANIAGVEGEICFVSENSTWYECLPGVDVADGEIVLTSALPANRWYARSGKFKIVDTGLSGGDLVHHVDWIKESTDKVFTYSGSKLDTIVYTDFGGITNAVKTYTYSGTAISNTTLIFDYDGLTHSFSTDIVTTGGKILSSITTRTII